jgi:hypothetical protein
VIGGAGDDPSIVGVGRNLLIKMPAPRRMKAWDELWSRYKAERALLVAYTTGELRESVKLEIFRIHLKPKVPAKGGRRRTGGRT